MKTKLKEIASIQVGYSFRVRLDFLDRGGVAVVQMKDLTEENFVDCTNLTRVNIKNVKKHHLLRAGDLIFRSRGQVTTAAILTEDVGTAVVASPLLRIRVDERVVSPEYLTWYISQPSSQAFLASRAKGTSQKVVGKQALESLEVIVPPLERQRTIVELAGLAVREQNLIKRIAERRKYYISQKLTKLAEGE